ncbi:MAG: glutaminyl-peptide cyclotransferase [Prevotellaceae bacterium]|jgi:glutamine cyclotransferase|nr:glutaminyl-peptide cyclotransferase [Prevotellaceae bacterium]
MDNVPVKIFFVLKKMFLQTWRGKRLSVLFLILFSIGFVSCISCRQNTERRTPKNRTGKKALFALASPQNGATLKSGSGGDVLLLDVKSLADSVKQDSCILNIDGKYHSTYRSLPGEVSLSSIKMGLRRMSLTVYSANNVAETILFNLKIVPSSAPITYKYKVVREYPHDDNAYTQGLFFSDGFLYEGTGQKGHSSLRKVELETGKVLQQHDLDRKYFGEGVCLHNGKIYQLTWENREGFIYDYNDFTLTGKFNYNTEGWGITGDGVNLWMSDGTSNLYKLNPDNLNVIGQLEVYTDRGAEENLNELEYIDGEIWANVYTKDYIVIINPQTGEVTGKIDLQGLLKKEFRKQNTDVLNGIAHDKTQNRIFVTGKNWLRLFELKIE